MSWLARSIANSLKLDDQDSDSSERNIDVEREKDEAQSRIGSSTSPPSPSTPGRGVKEDLSDITKTITRQLWGVASFLAPPPEVADSGRSHHSGSAATSDPETSDVAGIDGIRSDFAEIGGKFRSGIFKLSSNIAVSEITKIASNLLHLGSEKDDYDSVGSAVGVTEEVVAFARDIAMHPETWLDFPLSDDQDADVFNMSDAQQEHALAVESFAPRLAALRIELCPGYISEDCFWKIYFVLLHPRLSRHDAEVLSTPQIVKARALLTKELHDQTKAKLEQDWHGKGNSCLKDTTNLPHEDNLSVTSGTGSESVLLETSSIKSATSTVGANFEADKHQVPITEIEIVDKSVVEEGPRNWTNDQNLHSSSSEVVKEKYDDDGDDWLNEESSEIVDDGRTTIPIENEDDVSFSDLEDDDGDAPTSYRKVTLRSSSPAKDSRDWVQLRRSPANSFKDGTKQGSACNSERKGSNDWLDIDDIDEV